MHKAAWVKSGAHRQRKRAGHRCGVRPFDLARNLAPGGEEWRGRADRLPQGGRRGNPIRPGGLQGGGRAAGPALPLSRRPTLSTESPDFIAVQYIALQPCIQCISESERIRSTYCYCSIATGAHPCLRQPASHVQSGVGHPFDEKITQHGNAQRPPQFGWIGEKGAEHRAFHLRQNHLHLAGKADQIGW